MNETAMIGARIRALRLAQKMTLKQISEESGLSAGFLSQLERGMSSIAIDSLATLAGILGVSLASFFDVSQEEEPDPVMHGFDLHGIPLSPQIIQYVLSRDVGGYTLLPRLFLLQPQHANEQEDVETYSHEGEEFIYVLEGVVTVYLDGHRYTLYPGDSIQIRSNLRHNWANLTNKPARLLSVNFPNRLKEIQG